jgi:hypothetical protein
MRVMDRQVGEDGYAKVATILAAPSSLETELSGQAAEEGRYLLAEKCHSDGCNHSDEGDQHSVLGDVLPFFPLHQEVQMLKHGPFPPLFKLD